MRKRLPSRGHQRGSALAAAQAWVEKETHVSNPSKNKSIRLSKSLYVYGARGRGGRFVIFLTPTPGSDLGGPAAGGTRADVFSI